MARNIIDIDIMAHTKRDGRGGYVHTKSDFLFLLFFLLYSFVFFFCLRGCANAANAITTIYSTFQFQSAVTIQPSQYDGVHTVDGARW